MFVYHADLQKKSEFRKKVWNISFLISLKSLRCLKFSKGEFMRWRDSFPPGFARIVTYPFLIICSINSSILHPSRTSNWPSIISTSPATQLQVENVADPGFATHPAAAILEYRLVEYSNPWWHNSWWHNNYCSWLQVTHISVILKAINRPYPSWHLQLQLLLRVLLWMSYTLTPDNAKK